jgi:hypothetical protein
MPVRFRVRRAGQQSLFVTILVAALLAVLALPGQAHDGKMRWDCLAHYESSHRWHINTGNGYYGGLQFSLSTWKYFGGPSYSNNKYPHRATKVEQVVIAKRTAFKGWKDRPPQGGSSAWPNTWPLCD